jgi:hypothetical protein
MEKQNNYQTDLPPEIKSESQCLCSCERATRGEPVLIKYILPDVMRTIENRRDAWHAIRKIRERSMR